MGQVSFIRKQVLPGPQHQQIEIGDGVDSNEGDHIERDQCKIDQVLPPFKFRIYGSIRHEHLRTNPYLCVWPGGRRGEL